MGSSVHFSTHPWKAFRSAGLVMGFLAASACAKNHDQPSAADSTKVAPQAAPTPVATSTPASTATPSATPLPTATPTVATAPTPKSTPPVHVPSATAAVLDQTSSGGQPGFVYLYGDFVDDHKQLVDAVRVNEVAGLGWRGTRATARNGLLHLFPDVTDANSASTAATEKLGTYMSYGCDPGTLEELKGLKPAPKPSESDDQLVLRAQAVAFCGDEPFKTVKATMIVASHIIFSNLKMTSTSANTRLLSIVTERLKIENENTLALNGVDGPSTDQAAPSIVMSVHQLEGTGRFYIDSKGADYVKPAGAHTAAPAPPHVAKPKPKPKPKPQPKPRPRPKP